MESSAVISACGNYRYRLDRQVAEQGITIAYIGVNPSTADASIDDQTVKKWKGFTLVNGGKKFIVGNVFPFRATSVKDLSDPLKCIDPIGDFLIFAGHMKLICLSADIIVPCWGDRSKVDKSLHGRFDSMLCAIRGTGKPIKTFGFTKGGDPKHPLMLGYDTPLIDWIK